MYREILRAALLACLLILVASCKQPKTEKPPPSVTIAKPLDRELQEFDEYAGHLAATQVASVSARVSGIIEAAPFTEGTIVEKGSVLFVIDERTFRAEYVSRQADSARAQAEYAEADVRFKRYEGIKNSNAVSAADYDQAEAQLRQAQAGLAAAKALEEIANLNLEWTKVTAPISGRIGRKLVTEGNLVSSSGQVSILTTITAVDPIYCYVNVPERSFLKYQQLSHDRAEMSTSSPAKAEAAALAALKASVKLENESSFNRDGQIDFVDNRIDPATGTIELRGVFTNTDGRLLPGLFAKMRIPGSSRYHAILVPDNAIGTDQGSRTVQVVGDDGIVTVRPVTLGAQFGTFRSVTKGLAVTDRVVVNGLQAAKPGTKVTTQETVLADDSLKEFFPPAEIAQVVASADETPPPAPSVIPAAAATPAKPRR